VEFNQLGWNLLTLGLFGTFTTTLSLVWGLRYQSRNIIENKSGQSVSTVQFLYGVCSSMAAVVYGLGILKAALIINGSIMFVARFPVLRGLIRYKGLSVAEKATGTFLVMALAAMMVLPEKEGFYVMFQLGGIIFTVAQPWEIAKNRSSGVVEYRLLVVACVHSFFWLVYGYAIHNRVIIITSICGLMTNIVTILLWLKYRSSEK